MTTVDNKRILKNTFFLYIRMFLVMGISLYTVRAYLGILGEVDYGIYNVIGGVVSMLSFMNGTLAASSQRFISIALAEHDSKKANNVFCLGQSVYLVIIIFIVIILESVGLWFVNAKLMIPEERMTAANIVYQITIATFFVQMLSIAYYAMVIAQERMKAFAYIGIFEALLKLGFVFVLRGLPFDRLVCYAGLFFIINLSILIIYIAYCRVNFEESKFKFYWNKKDAMEILGFSGWHLLGTFSTIIRSSGVNILINTFFNPAVNAARAIAYQVEGALTKFSQNFFKAVIPQMYKTYANNEIKELYKLILRSTVICVSLVSLFAIPLYNNIAFVLGLWLKDVPEYTVQFAQLVLINAIIDAPSDSTICSALATGRIKKFYLITGSLYILVLPLAYVCLKLGCPAISTMFVSIAMSVAALFARAGILVDLIGFPLKDYIFLIIRLSLVSVAIAFCTYFSTLFFTSDWLALIFSTAVSSILHCLLYFAVVLEKNDRNIVLHFVKGKLKRHEKIIA